MTYDAAEFQDHASMLASRAGPSVLADMLRCAVEEAERLRVELGERDAWIGQAVEVFESGRLYCERAGVSAPP